MSAVPRAVWIGGGLLGAVTAGLAGALVMRSAPQPVSVAPAAAPSALVATTAAPLAGISSEAVAVAPLLIVSLAALHAVTAISARRGRR